MELDVKIIGNEFMYQEVNEKLNKLVHIVFEHRILLRYKPGRIVNRRKVHGWVLAIKVWNLIKILHVVCKLFRVTEKKLGLGIVLLF